MLIETGGTTKKSGTCFAVIVDGKDKYKYAMEDGTTLNFVELTAVKFAVMGCKMAAVITTKNRYVADMFLLTEQGEWIKEPKSNIRIVNEIRNEIKSKGNIKIEFQNSCSARELCK